MVSECSNKNFTTQDQNQHAKTLPWDQAKNTVGLWCTYDMNLWKISAPVRWLLSLTLAMLSMARRKQICTCNPHSLWHKATVWLVINRGVSYSPRHMIFNTKEHMKFSIKGVLLISLKWSNHGCFPSVLKCFADISCSTLQPFEKGWQTKVTRSYWAKQKYGKSQNPIRLKLLDRISCLVKLLL